VSVHVSSVAQQGAKLAGSGEVVSGAFWRCVGMSESEAVVGGPRDNAGVGAVWPFKRTESGWAADGEKLTGGGEVGNAELGHSVALSEAGTNAVAGGPFDRGVGAAWIFESSGGKWAAGGFKVFAHFATQGSHVRESVAISPFGVHVLVGGGGYEERSGGAWVFELEAEGGKSVWNQRGGALRASEGIEPEFGAAVAESSGGSPALVGAPLLSGGAGGALAFVPKAPSLEPPEVGICEKVGFGQGEYGGGNCTEPLGGGRHVWDPGLRKPGVTTKLATGTFKLETVKLSKVVCKGQSSTGEFVNVKHLEHVTLTLTGCERAGVKCTSTGALEGEVVSIALDGVLGIVMKA
jgi:hypothetical protein